MGWGRTLLLGDIGNRLDIADTEREIAQLKREINVTLGIEMSQNEKIDALLSENAELKLYIASLIRLLKAKGVISTAELTKVVNTIDAEDGTADGKNTGSIE